jgi:hypothetical protein
MARAMVEKQAEEQWLELLAIQQGAPVTSTRSRRHHSPPLATARGLRVDLSVPDGHCDVPNKGWMRVPWLLLCAGGGKGGDEGGPPAKEAGDLEYCRFCFSHVRTPPPPPPTPRIATVRP